MGINIGAFFATLLCGYLGETYGWKYGFGTAGLGMLFGLATFMRGRKYLLGHAEPRNPEVLKKKSVIGLSMENTIYFCAVLSTGIIWQMLQFHHIVANGLDVLSIIVLIGIIWFITTQCTSDERDQMAVLIVLILSTVVFWALFEQAAGSMTLYSDRVLNRESLGVTWTAAQFGSLNALFIFTLAPVFAWLWSTLGKRGLEPSIPVKFSIGIIQAGLGFGALVVGASMPDETGKVAAYWMVLAYLLHTTGELCLSPVGLSAVTKLAVPRVIGVMMGAWFLAMAYSEYVAVQIAKLATIETHMGTVTNIAAALESYTELFNNLFYFGLACGVLLLLISPILKKFMHGVN
tara:strand:- start:2188 stop:3231 length:1044 start_codon:yes stop_codon:yes gene_type:complete